MIISADPDDPWAKWTGDFIVFVAIPDEDGAEGIVSYAIGPFKCVDEAQSACRVAAKDWPGAFVRFCALRPPAMREHPIRGIVTTPT